jgi:putative phosphoribosyl transferase
LDSPAPIPLTREVRIPCGGAWLCGDLAVPRDFCGLVLFAHSSGNGRFSPRNRQIAQTLQHAGIATLLFDLLTTQEEEVDFRTREHRFDMALLARRMQDATDWVAAQADLQHASIGYFGASTGSAAALIAAARQADRVAAVVSRGGRPDLAGPDTLAAVRAPTLLIVGRADHGVIDLNGEAYEHLQCQRRLAIVAGATHRLVQHDALEQVSELAASWFATHLPKRTANDPITAPDNQTHQGRA